MRIDIFVHDAREQDSRIEQMLQQVLRKLDIIKSKEDSMSVALDNLTAQVAQNTTIEASAITLIQGLAAQIAAAGTDPAALAALQASLNASATSLAAAIAANTPAAPPAA
jgi:hypothetical protein